MFRRIQRFLAAAALLFLVLACPAAFAANKDMIQLQTQVQALQDAVARLQQSNDENMGVVKDLIQQTADSVNKMSVAVGALQVRMGKQEDAYGTKADQLSGQIQALNDSVDELKARLTRMEKSIGDLQSGQQSTNAMLGSLPQVTGGAAAPAGAATAPASTAPASTAPAATNSALPPAQGTPLPAGEPLPAGPAPPPTAGPSSGQMYRTAYSDYVAGRYPLAISEFNALIQTYPDDNLSGNAYFYLGEIDRRGNKPSAAIKNYDHTIEHFPDNSKIPAAQLHKGESLLAVHQTEAGVRELRALITRYPNSPEAAQARLRISGARR